MALIMNHTNEGLKIKGDEHLAMKLPEGYNVSTIDVSDVRIHADAVAQAFNDAESKGVKAVERYFAIKEKFMEQQRSK